jgi:hypothetical protein
MTVHALQATETPCNMMQGKVPIMKCSQHTEGAQLQQAVPVPDLTAQPRWHFSVEQLECCCH